MDPTRVLVRMDTCQMMTIRIVSTLTSARSIFLSIDVISTLFALILFHAGNAPVTPAIKVTAPSASVKTSTSVRQTQKLAMKTRNALIPSDHSFADVTPDSPTTTPPPSPDSSAPMSTSATRELTTVTVTQNVPIRSAAGTAPVTMDGKDQAILVAMSTNALTIHATRTLIAPTTRAHLPAPASLVLLREDDSVFLEIVSTLTSA